MPVKYMSDAMEILWAVDITAWYANINLITLKKSKQKPKIQSTRWLDELPIQVSCPISKSDSKGILDDTKGTSSQNYIINGNCVIQKSSIKIT